MKVFARHILLAALLLNALVPMGWMPGVAALGQGAWIICTAAGGITHGVPGKDENRQHHQPCAFAAAHVMAAPPVVALAAPLRAVATTETAPIVAFIRVASVFTPQSPRAPPALS